MKRRAIRLLMALLVILGTASVAVAADDEALIVVSPSSPASVEFSATGVAKLSVLVLNESDKAITPTAALYDATSGALLDSGGAFTSSISVPGISARGAGTVTVGIRRAGGKTDTKLDAVLVLSHRGMLSSSLRISEAKAPDPTAKAWVEPGTITVLATRSWPSFAGRLDMWFYVSEPLTYSVDVEGLRPPFGPRDALLSSDRGGRMSVQLQPPATSSDSNWNLRLGAADGSGEYSGKLAFDPSSEDAPTIDVTVNVQDFIVWPIIFLVAGALVAWALAYLRDVRHPKGLLEYHLARIRDLYSVARTGTCSAKRDHAWLEGAFGLTDGVAVDFDPRRKTLGDELYGRLRRASDAGQIEEIEQSIRDLEELVGTWEKMCEAAQGLEGRVRANRRIDRTAEVFVLARTLLNRTSRFTAPDAALEFVQQLNDQSAAIELFVAARKQYDRARELWGRLDDEERRRYDGPSPDDYWSAQVHGLGTKEGFVNDDVITALAEMYRDFLTVLRKRPQPEVELGFLGARGTADEAAMNVLAAAEEQAALITTIPKVERRPAAAILAAIRRLDVVDFVISAVVTGVVFLQGLYVGKNFGTEWDYLSAFLAALGGTLLINWKLLPWYRDYRLPKAS